MVLLLSFVGRALSCLQSRHPYTPTFVCSSQGNGQTPSPPLPYPQGNGQTPSLPSPTLLYSPLPLEVGPLCTARGSGELCGVWGKAPADKRIGAYWSQKAKLWWQQFLLIFLRTNVIFCTKTRLISHGGSNSSHTAVSCEEFFSCGSRHHCRVEVGSRHHCPVEVGSAYL